MQLVMPSKSEDPVWCFARHPETQLESFGEHPLRQLMRSTQSCEFTHALSWVQQPCMHVLQLLVP